MGDGFRAEPEGLKYAADVELQKLVDQLGSSKHELNDTGAEDCFAFSGHTDVVAVQTAWLDARADILKALDANIENIGLSQRALSEVADRYTAVEQRSATRMRAVF